MNRRTCLRILPLGLVFLLLAAPGVAAEPFITYTPVCTIDGTAWDTPGVPGDEVRRASETCERTVAEAPTPQELAAGVGAAADSLGGGTDLGGLGAAAEQAAHPAFRQADGVLRNADRNGDSVIGAAGQALQAPRGTTGATPAGSSYDGAVFQVERALRATWDLVDIGGNGQSLTHAAQASLRAVVGWF